MKEQFFTCPFCGKKILCVTAEPINYMWTKCEHLLYLELNDRDTLYSEDNIRNFLQKAALPVKFLKDYLDAQSRKNKDVKKIAMEIKELGISDSIRFLVQDVNPVAYCVKDKKIFLWELKSFIMNILPVKKVEINLRSFYTLYFCKENIDKNIQNKLFKFESLDGFANLSKLPEIFWEKAKEEKLEEIADQIELSVEEFEKLDDKEDIVQEYIIDKMYSNPPEIFGFMRKIGLNPEEYIEKSSLNKYFESMQDYNPLEENIEKGKLRSLGFKEKETKRIYEHLMERNPGKILDDTSSYFLSLRKVLERFVEKQLQVIKSRSNLIPVNEYISFREKVNILVREKIISGIEEDLTNTWKICSKYVHPQSSPPPPELIMGDFLRCKYVILHILKNC